MSPDSGNSQKGLTIGCILLWKLAFERVAERSSEPHERGGGRLLYVTETPHGVMVTPYDPGFEKVMEVSRCIMARDREALKELAK